MEIRFDILSKLGIPFSIGSNKFELPGIIDIMKLNSELIASAEEIKSSGSIELATSLEVTKQNELGLRHVWLLMNGLTDGLPIEYDLLNLLIIGEWINYFNVPKENAEVQRVQRSTNLSIKELVEKDGVTVSDDVEKLLVNAFARERARVIAHPENVDLKLMSAYQDLLQPDLSNDSDLNFAMAFGTGVQKATNMGEQYTSFNWLIQLLNKMIEKKDFGDIYTKWSNKFLEWYKANVNNQEGSMPENIANIPVHLKSPLKEQFAKISNQPFLINESGQVSMGEPIILGMF